MDDLAEVRERAREKGVFHCSSGWMETVKGGERGMWFGKDRREREKERKRRMMI